jgi:Fe2+ transport system protein B
MMSWDWPTSYESIAPYFLPQSWKNQDFQDISTSCHIWGNCKKVFKIHQHVLNNLRRCRNIVVAHNPILRVTDFDKSKVFDALKDLFKDADVMLHIDAKDCLSEIDRIEKSEFLLYSLKSVLEAIESQDNFRGIEERQNEMERHLHERVISMIKAEEENIGNKKRNGIMLSFFCMAIFIAIFGIVLQFRFNYNGFEDKTKVNFSSIYKGTFT